MSVGPNLKKRVFLRSGLEEEANREAYKKASYWPFGLKAGTTPTLGR